MKTLTHWLKRFFRKRIRNWWYVYEWPIVWALTLAVLSLGCVGFSIYLEAKGESAHLPELVFKSLQLFMLKISVSGAMPWQLDLAHLLAPLISAYTGFKAFFKVFSEQISTLWLRTQHDHVIICGLGRKGLYLARSFLGQGRTVVVIEQDKNNEHTRECSEFGGIILTGDATLPWVLHKAGIQRAGHLFILCGDDGVNAEIAVAAASLVGSRPEPRLACVLHIVDSRLCTLLQQRQFVTTNAERLSLEFFNVYDLGAKLMLKEHLPSLAAGDPVPPIVVVGAGKLGISLLLHAGRLWHKAKGEGRHPVAITVVDKNASKIIHDLLVHHPRLKDSCRITTCDMDIRSALFQRAEFVSNSEITGVQTRVFICIDDDSLCLSAALALVTSKRQLPIHVVVRMSQESGLATLLHGTGSTHNISAFGLLDHTCQSEEVIEGMWGVIARSTHESYFDGLEKLGKSPKEFPAMKSWSKLDETFKQSNREQAQDIGTKLKAIGCSIIPIEELDEASFKFTEPEIDLLANMEHERFVKSRQRDGWTLGPRNVEKKTNPCLIPYSELPKEEQDKDIEAVRRIPELLATAGFKICRSAQRNPPLTQGR